MRKLAAIENDHVGDSGLETYPLIVRFMVLSVCHMKVPRESFAVSELVDLS